jgi:hypothetical protein
MRGDGRTAGAGLELRDLLLDWDPIGIAEVCPRDEYDCVIGPLLCMLERNATEREIAGFLESKVQDHFGLKPVSPREAALAADLKVWFQKCCDRSSASGPARPRAPVSPLLGDVLKPGLSRRARW